MTISSMELPQSRPPIMASALEVLLIDDDEFDLTRLNRLVQKIGKNVVVTSCSSIEEFRHISQGCTFDICLLDLKLGADSGLDIVNVLRESDDHKELPVVMVSGMQDTDAVVQAIKAGCENFMEKDHLTAEKLRRVIFDALESSMPQSSISSELHAATDNVIQGIAQGCIQELKPRLNRIYRQIGFIKDCHNHGYFPSPEAFDVMEENCLAIWRFFDEIDAYSKSFGETLH